MTTSKMNLLFAIPCLLSMSLSPTWAVETFEFLIRPRDTPAIQGETVTMYCSLNQAADTVMWVRDTVVISNNLQVVGEEYLPRFSISYDGLAYNLVINGVLARDAGSYKCVAFSDGNGIISPPATLEVSAPPLAEYPTLVTNINNLDIAVGETVEVICAIEGGSPVPKIELVKGNETLVNASGQVVYVWVTEADDDGAMIECRAVHPLWSESRSDFIGPFNLITESPQVVLAPPSAEIAEDASTSFVCSAFSAPRAVYRWFINGVEQAGNQDGSVVIDSIETASLLHVRGSATTSGIVRCDVTASTGDASSDATLTVILTKIPTAAPATPSTATPTATNSATPEPVTQTAPSTAAPRKTGAPTTRVTIRATPTTIAPAAETGAPAEPTTTIGPANVTTTAQHETSAPGRSGQSSQMQTGESAGSTSAAASRTERSTTIDYITVAKKDNGILGASSFDTIFIIAVSTIVSLVVVIFFVAIISFCIVHAKRSRRHRHDVQNDGMSRDGDVYFRSRYIGIVRSWFKPVHKDTQNTLTSFEGLTPDQSPYNTITEKR